MREIKYRGLTKDGKLVKGSLVSLASKRYIVYLDATPLYSLLPIPYVRLHEVLPETVGQYTGLKDKNGKEELYGDDRVVIGQDRGVLVWDELELAWGIQLDDGEINVLCRYYTTEELENIEYLGNIHQNPELMEKQ